MPGGWAKSKPERRPQSRRGLRGVFLSDMPSGKPWFPRRKIRGLPGLSEADGDYAPGEGTWYDAERGQK